MQAPEADAPPSSSSARSSPMLSRPSLTVLVLWAQHPNLVGVGAPIVLACFTKAPPNFIDNRMSTHVKTRQEHHLKTILDRHPVPFLPCLVIVQLLFEIACCVQLLLCLVHGLKTGIEPAAGPCMPHAARVAAIKSAPDASTVFAALVALGLPELLSPSWSRLCAPFFGVVQGRNLRAQC